jgi:hypothetical protein
MTGTTFTASAPLLSVNSETSRLVPDVEIPKNLPAYPAMVQAVRAGKYRYTEDNYVEVGLQQTVSLKQLSESTPR